MLSFTGSQEIKMAFMVHTKFITSLIVHKNRNYIHSSQTITPIFTAYKETIANI